MGNQGKSPRRENPRADLEILSRPGSFAPRVKCAAIINIALLVLSGCGEVSSATDGGSESSGEIVGMPGIAVVEATVDVLAACGIEGASQVSLRATRIACEQDPPPPCTIEVDPYKTVFGDLRECASASETAAKLRVEIDQPGRYLIDARIITASGYVSSCHGQSGDIVTLVSSDAVAEGSTVVVDDLKGPCPEQG